MSLFNDPGGKGPVQRVLPGRLDGSGNFQDPNASDALAAGEAHLGSVGGNSIMLERTWKVTGGDAALPATPTAYALGAVIGTEFNIPVGRVNGGSGTIFSLLLEERLNAAAYVNEPVTATNASPCVFTRVAHGLVNGNRVRLGGTVPATGFTAGVTYYVVNKAADTFQLAATLGGAGINSTSTGTSVTFTEVSAQIPIQLLLSRATFAAPKTDGTVFDPTYADSGNLKPPLTFNSWQSVGVITATAGGRHAGAPLLNLNLPFVCMGGSQLLYGILLNAGVATQVLSPNGELLLRAEVGQD